MLNTTNNISPIPTRNYKPQVSKHDIDIVGKTISKTVKKASKAVKRDIKELDKPLKETSLSHTFISFITKSNIITH